MASETRCHFPCDGASGVGAAAVAADLDRGRLSSCPGFVAQTDTRRTARASSTPDMCVPTGLPVGGLRTTTWVRNLVPAQKSTHPVPQLPPHILAGDRELAGCSLWGCAVVPQNPGRTQGAHSLPPSACLTGHSLPAWASVPHLSLPLQSGVNTGTSQMLTLRRDGRTSSSALPGLGWERPAPPPGSVGAPTVPVTPRAHSLPSHLWRHHSTSRSN